MSMLPFDHQDLTQELRQDELVEGKLRARETPEVFVPAQNHATVGVFRALWRKLFGRGVDWGHRAAEATVTKLEAEAAVLKSQSVKNMADARKAFMEADAIKAKAEMEMRERAAEFQDKEAIRLVAIEEYQRRQREPQLLQDIADEISEIRRAGGDVQLNPEDVNRLLGESPGDEAE